ncbi:MAG: MFS transporter [Rhodospirillaceae bacterium]|jgi:MFS transporter, OFA family, oxalate/formate antiporter|nr:MFS transporter [Rhodospirillaceae bacterium]MBT6203585.1 MFS transporter [Rhodospirillaceae bacterium]MBT6510455.1 MFS transporter [Rhodospirillaceae bacterium]MBT7612445.1 MFS transporter [Rhodospirillaceae bacterium]MBT7645818.1 MFS transporter [Rhodospirillaceae bacterium]
MRPAPAFAAAILLTTALGSVHAFSVFVAPLEDTLEAGRDTVSLAYSIALLSITAAVLFGPRVWRLGSPALIAALSFLLAAIGMALATVPSVWALYLGYGLFFGLANGSGYGFALVIASHALPNNRGVGMGVVTAVYAVGAMMAAWLFRVGNASVGHETTLLITAAVFALLALVAAFLLHHSRLIIDWPDRSSGSIKQSGVTTREIALLWVGFGAGGMAGLMALGHAAEIVRSHGGAETIITIGVMIVTGTNAVGGFAAGWLADRGQIRRMLLGLPVLAFVALLVLATNPGPHSAIALLALVQISYGGIIVLYAVVVTQMAGPSWGPVIYGRIFTCWGVVGFAGPWLAGWLFEETGDYTLSFIIAAGIACFSTIAIWFLRQRISASGAGSAKSKQPA